MGHIARDCAEKDTRWCKKCDRGGHLAKDCFRACFKCGETGHQQWQCGSEGKRDGEGNMMDEEEEQEFGYYEEEEQGFSFLLTSVHGEQGSAADLPEMYLDSGATGHFVKESSHLHEYNKLPDGKFIGSAKNGASIPIVGEGRIHNWGRARHLAGLRKNLISPGQLYREKRYTTILTLTSWR